eukprot:5810784-Pyramimonas_sp.AAC.1
MVGPACSGESTTAPQRDWRAFAGQSDARRVHPWVATDQGRRSHNRVLGHQRLFKSYLRAAAGGQLLEGAIEFPHVALQRGLSPPWLEAACPQDSGSGMLPTCARPSFLYWPAPDAVDAS